MDTPQKILVIKLSALGDFIQALGHMRAIRAHHKDAHITLMTTPFFKNLAIKSRYFDDILIDTKPKFYQFIQWNRLKRTFKEHKFDRIYDLQNNDRTKIYMSLFKSPTHTPQWASTHNGATYQNTNLNKQNSHAVERHKETLRIAGITNVTHDNLSWIAPDTAPFFDLPTPYALLVPGCAPSRPEKRWPSAHYGALAHLLAQHGITPIIIGTKSEHNLGKDIVSVCSEALNLTGKTSLFDLPTLGRKAKIIIGNDTGPMHIFGATNTLCLTLFSKNSDPIRHAPCGENVTYIQQDNLDDLAPKTVWSKIQKVIPSE